jgi:hypothetical protein
MSTLAKRLDTHFAACAAAAAGAALGGADKANAALVYSGPVNITVPDNIDGIYMNVVNGAAVGNPPPAGWDINPYSVGAPGTTFNLWGPTANTWFAIGGATGDYTLPTGTLISGAAALFFRPGGTTSAQDDVTLNSTDNIFGFRFINEAMGNQVQFGWVRISFGANLGTRSITEYAYDDTGAGVLAGVVPAPGALALLGLAGLVGPRRRRN